METSLTWLGRMIREPSQDDWRRLYEVYTPLLSLWATRAGIPATDHDDLIQKVAMVVVKRIAEFKHQHPGAFRGWLRAILANHIKHYYRDKKTEGISPLNVNDMEDPNSQLSRMFDLEHDQFLANRAMKMAAGDFTDTTWAAFEMQVIENIEPAVVAQQLGLTLNSVLKSKSRVLKRIRQELDRLV